MKFNYSKLRGRIVEKYGTCANFATALGWSKTQLSARLNNVVPFSSPEVKQAATLLEIPGTEIDAYFFAV